MECVKDIESKMHFFLHCTNILIPKQTLFQKIRHIDDNLSQSQTQLVQTLMYNNQIYHPNITVLIIEVLWYLQSEKIWSLVNVAALQSCS